jgi:hypothetical protein
MQEKVNPKFDPKMIQNGLFGTGLSSNNENKLNDKGYVARPPGYCGSTGGAAQAKEKK